MNVWVVVFVFLFLLMLVGMVAFLYYSKYKKIRKALGRNFVESIEKGGKDGILIGEIVQQDLDFKFVPIVQRENGFYYIQMPNSKDPEDKLFMKINKSDVYLFRGRILTAFVVEDKVRAADINQLKKIAYMPLALRAELKKDYAEYISLKEKLKRLEAKLATGSEDIERISEEIKKTKENLTKLEQKWGLVFIELQEGRPVLIPEEDNKYTLVMPLNFGELAEFMSGVKRSELTNEIRWAVNKKVEGIIKDLAKRFGMKIQQPSSGFNWNIVFMFFALLAMMGMFALMAKALAG
ncbi:membrane protein [Pyrococcus abyssi virus 1]|uniref:membrane protein n=1 Tax=Pyrococcus abyssi virus 1 TaxID=425386 RepID=UPI00015529B9|nr:membrane protein [Pyrococcus abyssi virus 1]ABN58496.1 membrane protein [Pyrococcus abyssi virus 1]